MTLATEPAQVLLDERPSQSLGSQCPRDIDRQPVVQLVGRSVADLTHRHLQLPGLLTGRHPVGVDTVRVPGQVDRRGPVAAPAASAADRRIVPCDRPQHQSPGVPRRMPPVMYRQSPKTSPAHNVPHSLHAVTPSGSSWYLVRPTRIAPTQPGRRVRSDCRPTPGPRRSPSRVLRSTRRWSGSESPSPSVRT